MTSGSMPAGSSRLARAPTSHSPRPLPSGTSAARACCSRASSSSAREGREVLRAFAALRARRPDAELWIVGPQHLRIDEPGVRVLGRVRRADAPGGMPDLYRRATLLAMPSFYDPFPTVFREAMAYRLPCIGSTSCSIPEMVLDGVTGYVVPAGDHAALAERMIELADDPDKAQRFGE